MDDSSDLKVSSSELVPSERDAYLFPMAGDAWYAVSDDASSLPDTFVERHPFHSLIGISLNFGSDWEDRFFLLDPSSDARQLPFFVRLMRELGPALQHVYLQGRLNSAVGERERARVARELHDSTVQSLIGLEMELAAWRSTLGDGSSDLSAHLTGIQKRLREEIVGIRELLQELRPVHVDPSRLMDYLSEMVNRFQRETGIAASFASTVNTVDMSREVCSGLCRILQEALVNIRKHSGARNVTVRFSHRGSRWALVVDDDGSGFDPVLKGPAVITERVRGLGGQLKLESTPQRGARLEVTLPGAVHV